MDKEFIEIGCGCQIADGDGGSVVGEDKTCVIGNEIRMSFSEESAINEAEFTFHSFVRCSFVYSRL